MNPALQAPRYVSYLRVSTAKQGATGLGIEAQRHTVTQYLASGKRKVLLQEFVEVESGKKNTRPQLAKALELANLTGAILIIAKLDRLSRNAHFLTGLAEAGVEFVACDLPEANKLTVTIMAAVAEHERDRIAQRTKDALGAAKARGIKLGNPNGAAHLAGRGNDEAVAALKRKADHKAQRLSNTLRELRATGTNSARGIAMALNSIGILSPRGKLWDAKGVTRLQARIATID
jgi:DNA invertase Pin-like site-specific DNA recombinase